MLTIALPKGRGSQASADQHRLDRVEKCPTMRGASVNSSFCGEAGICSEGLDLRVLSWSSRRVAPGRTLYPIAARAAMLTSDCVPARSHFKLRSRLRRQGASLPQPPGNARADAVPRPTLLPTSARPSSFGPTTRRTLPAGASQARRWGISRVRLLDYGEALRLTPDSAPFLVGRGHARFVEGDLYRPR